MCCQDFVFERTALCGALTLRRLNLVKKALKRSEHERETVTSAGSCGNP